MNIRYSADVLETLVHTSRRGERRKRAGEWLAAYTTEAVTTELRRAEAVTTELRRVEAEMNAEVLGEPGGDVLGIRTGPTP